MDITNIILKKYVVGDQKEDILVIKEYFSSFAAEYKSVDKRLLHKMNRLKEKCGEVLKSNAVTIIYNEKQKKVIYFYIFQKKILYMYIYTILVC